MSVTIQDSRTLGATLREKSPHVLGIDLIGSTVRNGKGHDADMIALVDDELAREWWADVSDTTVRVPYFLLPLRRVMKILFRGLDEALIHTRKASRQARASRLLGVDIALLSEDYRPGVNIDIFLLPIDWREGKHSNWEALGRIGLRERNWSTRAFFTHAARDAIRLE